MHQSLVLVSSLVSVVLLAPAPDQLDFQATYMQFFKIKDIIDKINIKRFEEFYGPVLPPTTQTPLRDVVAERDYEESDLIPEIDLTEEAILNDEVVVKVAPAAAPDTEITTASIDPEESTTTLSPITSPPSGEEVTTLQPDDVQDNEVDSDLDSDESLASVRKYGYKILLKNVDGKEVAIGKIKFTIPTIVPAHEDGAEDEIEDVEVVTEAATESVEVVTEALSETTEPVEVVTEAVPETTESVEMTTEVNVPVAITAVIPSLEDIEERDLAQEVRRVVQDTEMAVEEIKNQTASEVIVFGECSAPLTEVEAMLADLARNVAAQSDNLAEILTLGNTIKDQTEPESLARTGAEILRLVEPLLSSLVPGQVESCAGSSSSSMLVSLSGLASQLDSLAAGEEDEARAESLQSTATSLQLAAWVISTLQHSVQSFYTQDGICGEESSSTAEILGSLSQAIRGYIPIVSMLGNTESVQELERTILALTKAQEDIMSLESQTGTSLPGVRCGASFTEMAAALDSLADFLQVLQTNSV